jgi:hypothetical protein
MSVVNFLTNGYLLNDQKAKKTRKSLKFAFHISH